MIAAMGSLERFNYERDHIAAGGSLPPCSARALSPRLLKVPTKGRKTLTD